MMNYEIFKEVVKEKFLDYMPEKYKGMEVVTAPVEKVNMTLDGLSPEKRASISHLPFISTICIRDIRTVRTWNRQLWEPVMLW